MSTLAPLDLERPPQLGTSRRLLALLALAVVAVAWWRVLDATAEVALTSTVQAGVPVDLLVPEGAQDAAGVVVAHGFSGSRQLMRSTALALADAGFVVAVPDLSGHGANATPLVRDDGGDQLTADVLSAVDALTAVEGVAGDRVGVLGHSMGSGAVLRAGIVAPERIAAVVAVSPTDAEVTREAPGDLLLLAGALEPRYAALAEDLLERAGGPAVAGDDGPGRALEIIDGVEHVTILFSTQMHATAAAFLATALAHDVEPLPDALPPIGWWLLHLAAVLTLWRAVVPLLADRGAPATATGRGVAGAALGAFAATAVLAVADAAVDLTGLGGMLVGPLLAGWFLLAGVVWLSLGPRPGPPRGRDAAWAVVLVVVLLLALAVLGSRVWLPALPTGPRLLLAVVFVPALLPWSLALATTIQGPRGLRAGGWWVLLVAVVTGGLGVAASVVEPLRFLVLLLPLIPVVLTVTAVAFLPLQRPWAAAGATSVLLAWLMAVLFPLV